jgi:hypothetical protein
MMTRRQNRKKTQREGEQCGSQKLDVGIGENERREREKEEKEEKGKGTGGLLRLHATS